jgi:hypothetical protein
MSTVVETAERVGPAFTVDGMLLAREKTREAIRQIAARVKPLRKRLLETQPTLSDQEKFYESLGMHRVWFRL